MEYLRHFDLADDPFRNEPQSALFLDSGTHQSALQRLERAVRQSRGLSVLAGEPGAGKTMVLRRLLDDLEEEVFEASMLVVLGESAGPEWLLRRLAVQLGEEEPEDQRDALLAQIYDQLAIVREDGRHAVLIIDDAQALSSRETLAEIGALLKLEYEERRLLSIVLAGVPALEAALAAHPVLSPRVDVRVRLAPMDVSGTRAYLAHRLQAAKGSGLVIEDDAVVALAERAEGRPGRVNTLADNALFEAYLAGRNAVSREDVERAHRDLQWGAEAEANASGPAKNAPSFSLDAASDEMMSSAGDTLDLVDQVDFAPAVAAAATSGRSAPVDTGLKETLEELDSELEAVFEVVGETGQQIPVTADVAQPIPVDIGAEAPTEGPPKDEDDEVADLFAELIED